ncbi:MAG TPA: hypothetical protein PK859_12375 [Spirochaetota bacterium]|nr:hypothetical protein [Spirochaetota bacterium]
MRKKTYIVESYPDNQHYLITKETINNYFINFNTNKKKKCAVFTMIQNEPVFLPIWLKYYTKYFSEDDLFILDHRSNDNCIVESAVKYNFNVIRLEYPFSFDHVWFKFTAEMMQATLLQHYECVIFTDVDEILLPDPNIYKGLDDYIFRLKNDYVKCKAYELIHFVDKEKAFDSTKSILQQRQYWYRFRFFDKSLVTKKPLIWTLGFHSVVNYKPRRDKNLYLIHLHKLDYSMCWQRTHERAQRRWNSEDIDNKRGWQNRITEEKKFYKFFYNFPILATLRSRKIPDRIVKKNFF